MQTQVHFHENLEGTEWMVGFTISRVNKLKRFLDASASAHVSVEELNHSYSCKLSIHNKGHDYSFTGEGDNYYEMVANTIEKARRKLSEVRRMQKDKISRHHIPLKEIAI